MSEVIERVERAIGAIVVCWTTGDDGPGYRVVDRSRPGTHALGAQLWRDGSSFDVFDERGLQDLPAPVRDALSGAKARAAIQAMRNPTEAMVETGQQFRTRHSIDVTQRWKAMVDAALTP